MQRTLSMMAGMMCGLVVGAVAALLLAPQSGAELRGHTEEWFGAAMEEARHAAMAKRIELQDQFAALKRGDVPQP
jgi:gas vesicle protein